MHKRLIILCIVILAALCGLIWLGHHARQKWAQGLEGARLGEFAEVAEQIRQDVKRKLDEFIHAEQERPYSDYLYFYVPENIVDNQQQQLTLLRSPLGEQLENGMAYGYFQVEPDGGIVTPYYKQGESQADAEPRNEVKTYIDNLKQSLLPTLSTVSGTFRLPAREVKIASMISPPAEPKAKELSLDKKSVMEESVLKTGTKGKAYPIESLKAESQQSKVLTQQRSIAASNVNQQMEQPSPQTDSNLSEPRQNRRAFIGRAREYTPYGTQGRLRSSERQGVRDEQTPAQGGIERPALRGIETPAPSGVGDTNTPRADMPADRIAGPDSAQSAALSYGQGIAGSSESRSQMLQNQPQRAAPPAGTRQLAQSAHEPEQVRPETVQIRIEPFVPVVITGKKSEQSIFGGQIFLLRHIQIEDRHLLQGFQLNEEKLVEQVKDSARRFMRDGMTFVLAQAAGETGGPSRLTGRTAYTAILGFGFGDLVLNLMEDDPGRIARQITQLRNWYIGITAMVVLAVTLALVSLWHNVRTQVHLSQQKDEFISAVSHELRTPLTSIRMYSEMLENNWVKSQEKLGEYYRTMRQESERLSRLIENVLDFSKIQKGKKNFAFNIGDINRCIADVVEMMRPYAAQHGFSITTYLGQVGQTVFDKDAVTQIVVNLLDNAIKYARVAGDKTITVRTAKQQQFTVIEVEDHGPGIPHRQRKKVFDQFYNYGAEVTSSGQRPTAPQSTGTGLGLTLVKKFAEAHNGFVEIVSAEPTGTIFRVGLAAKA